MASTQKRVSQSKKKTLHITRKKEAKALPLEILFHSLKFLVLAVVIAGFMGLGLVYGVAKSYVDTIPSFDIMQLTISDRTSYLYDLDGEEIMSMASI